MTVWLDESAEAELVRRLRDRDPQAAEDLVRLFLPKLKGFARNCELQEQDACSVALEALEKVIRAIDSFASRPGSTFRSWVFRIMLNCIRDFARRRARQRQHETSLDDLGELSDGSDGEEEPDSSVVHRQRMSSVTPVDLVGGTQLTSVTDTLLERLSPRERDVMTRTAGGMRDEAIASDLGIGVVSVRVTRLRARKRAAAILADILPSTDEAIQLKLRKLIGSPVSSI